MLSFLKNHPFAVEAFFESSLVLTFAVPKDELTTLIPECLTLDTFNDKWAFIAVALVRTTGLRPKGFPAIFGNNFFLIGYRIFVRYSNEAGKSLRGLYILRSETDKKKMEWLGNIFTHYAYTTTDISETITDDKTKITSIGSGLNIEIETGNEDSALPTSSPFADWKEARKYAGPLPHTFTYDKAKKEVLMIEGVRHNWKPAPVRVINYQIPFIESLGLKEVVLANAFIIRNVPYHWKKGRIEKWKG
jgi:hypothetical protein